MGHSAPKHCCDTCCFLSTQKNSAATEILTFVEAHDLHALDFFHRADRQNSFRDQSLTLAVISGLSLLRMLTAFCELCCANSCRSLWKSSFHILWPMNCYIMVSYQTCLKNIKILPYKMHLSFPRVSLDWVGQEEDFDNVTFYFYKINIFILMVIWVREICSLWIPRSNYC